MADIINISTSVLKVHPRNQEFFDDISGADYERFRDSIKNEGIITPLIIAPDMIIISGHQRYKAAIDSNFSTVPIIIRPDLIDEKDKLKVLLVANFGRAKNDPVKQGKIYKEYAELKGIRQGSANPKGINQYIGGGDNRRDQITQEMIAKELGVSEKHLRELKSLTNLPSELQDLISEGKVTATTGYKVLTRLTEDEQEELISQLDVTKKHTQRQVQEYIDKIRELESREPEAYEETKQMLTGVTEIKEQLEEELNKVQQELSSTKSTLDTQKRLLETTADERAVTSANLRDLTSDILVALRPFTIMKNIYKKLPGEDQHEIYSSVNKIQECVDKVKTQMTDKNEQSSIIPQPQERQRTTIGGAEPENKVLYSVGCDIDRSKFAVEQAMRLQMEISSLDSTLNYYLNFPSTISQIEPE